MSEFDGKSVYLFVEWGDRLEPVSVSYLIRPCKLQEACPSIVNTLTEYNNIQLALSDIINRSYAIYVLTEYDAKLVMEHAVNTLDIPKAGPINTVVVQKVCSILQDTCDKTYDPELLCKACSNVFEVTIPQYIHEPAEFYI